LILSKHDGTIIRSTGLPSEPAAAEPDFRASVASLEGSRPAFSQEAAAGSGQVRGQKTAESVARLVFTFVSAAGEFSSGLEQGNDVQLLRVRTKKSEIVIVPGMC
jgi:dynein light chain roadblock-type